jgi:hypothetical protein
MDILDLLKNPTKAKIVLENAIYEKNKELAELLIPIVRDPWLTCKYAQVITKNKIKDEWEEIIARDPAASLDYASYVLKGPFPKGENNLSKNPDYAYLYAKDVLKGPFPKGEDAIAKEAPLALSYAKEILKNRFKKGEDAIIKSEIENPDNDWGGDGESCFTSYVKFLESIGKLDEFIKDHPGVEKWIS